MFNHTRAPLTVLFSFLLLACTPDGSEENDGSADTQPPNGEGGTTPVTGIAFERIDIPGGAFTDLRFIPGTDNEFIVTQHEGTLVHVRIANNAAEVLGQVTVPEVLQEVDCGLLAVGIDTLDSPARYVYAGHCTTDYAVRITRFTWDPTDYDATAASATTTFEADAPAVRFPFNHNVGSLLVQEDGAIFFTIGDKGDPVNAQATNRLTAALLHIMPNREIDGSGHSPVATETAFEDCSPSLYARGLRYGWRLARDRQGNIWVGDVGESEAEELNIAHERGLNFGWSDCDGPCSPANPAFRDPQTHWGRSDAHPYYADDPDTEPSGRRSIWVGSEYRAGENDPYEGFLDGRVFFGDTCLGWVRGGRADSNGNLIDDEHLAHLPYIVGWEQGSDGFAYAATFGSCDASMMFEPGQLWRAIPQR